ncbi:CorA family divalent cation transporter [Streptomyces sp. NPDC058682]|uniref:CorA family divalent cation transporter n=1 Tax=Streptomyces sp. NPDC058682 TaxID=3346596 RepID=UPI00365D5A62
MVAQRGRTNGEGLPSAVVDCALYEDGRRIPGQVNLATVMKRIDPQEGRFARIGLYEPTEEQLQEVAEAFGLHPLAVEDAVHAHQRPRLERYDDMLFLVLKTIVYVDQEKVTATSEIVDTGEDHGLRQPRVRDHRPPRQRTAAGGRTPTAPGRSAAAGLRTGRRPARGRGHGRRPLHGRRGRAFAGDVDSLEAEVFSPDRPVDAGRIYQLKRELLEFKRAVMPLAGAMQRLSEGTFPGIPAKVATYFRDVADHHQRVSEQILFSTNSSPACSAPASPSSASSRTPTCAASAPGPPSLPLSPYGYPAVWVLILTVCIVIYRALRRNKWL